MEFRRVLHRGAGGEEEGEEEEEEEKKRPATTNVAHDEEAELDLPDGPGVWRCAACTVVNVPAELPPDSPTDTCFVCGARKGSSLAPAFAPASPQSRATQSLLLASEASGASEPNAADRVDQTMALLHILQVAKEREERRQVASLSSMMPSLLAAIERANARVAPDGVLRNDDGNDDVEQRSQSNSKPKWACSQCTFESTELVAFECPMCEAESVPRRKALGLVRRICTKILREPTSEKLRRVKTAKVETKVGGCEAIQLLAELAGFRSEEDGWTRLATDRVLEPLQLLVDKIDALLDGNTAAAAATDATAAADAGTTRGSVATLEALLRDPSLTPTERLRLQTLLFMALPEDQQLQVRASNAESWAQLHKNAAILRIAEGDARGALVHVDQALTVTTKLTAPREFSILLAYKSRCLLGLGRRQDADEYYDRVDWALVDRGCGNPRCTNCARQAANLKWRDRLYQ